MAVQLDYACVGNCSSTSTHDTRICTEEHVHVFQLHFFPFEWQYKHYACVGNCSSISTHDTRICTEEHVHVFQLHFFPFEWQYKHYACVGNCSSISTHDTRICTEEHVHVFQLHFFHFEWQYNYKHATCKRNRLNDLTQYTTAAAYVEHVFARPMLASY